jgi:hypothetical protein
MDTSTILRLAGESVSRITQQLPMATEKPGKIAGLFCVSVESYSDEFVKLTVGQAEGGGWAYEIVRGSTGKAVLAVTDRAVVKYHPDLHYVQNYLFSLGKDRVSERRTSRRVQKSARAAQPLS